jgi:DNA-binding NarL/FixJ family response regulator
MISAHDDDEYVKAAMDAGAMGYLTKHTSPDSVCSAIRTIQKGKTFFSPSIRLQKLCRKSGTRRVSPRRA